MLIIVTLTAGISAGAQNSTSVQSNIKQGTEYLKSQQYAKAVKSYEAALKEDPTQKEALSGIVTCYAYLDQLKNAQAVIDKAISAKANDSELIILKAKVYGMRGQFENAIAEFEKVATSAPDSLKSNIYSNISALRNQIYKYEDASIDAQKAITLNDKNADAYMNLGFAQYSLNRYVEAIDNFSYAINLSPNNSQAYYNRGMAYFKTNDKNNGCADMLRSRRLGNKNAGAQYLTDCGK